MRDQVHFAAFTDGARCFQSDVLDHFAGRHRCRRLVGKRPATIFFNLDRDRLVPFAVEVCEDRSCRRERDFMFTGSAAIQHTNAKTFHDFRIQESGARYRSHERLHI